MKFTKIPADTFQKLVLNAGILVDSFTPSTGTIGNLMGATTGGIAFNSNPTFVDFGEDVDNCPNNTKQLKQIQQYDPAMSGTFLTLTAAVAKALVGAADIDLSDDTHVIPRDHLVDDDFDDVWWIGDYSNINKDGASPSTQKAGFLAIHLMNGLNTGGFQITSAKNAKGQMAFDFHGHYDMNDIENIPFEVYCKAGTGSAVPSIYVDQHVLHLKVGGSNATLIATVEPSGETVTWTSSATGKASVTSGGVVAPVSEGSAIITAAITVDGVTYTDTCTVVVAAAS